MSNEKMTSYDFRKEWMNENPSLNHVPNEYELDLMNQYSEYQTALLQSRIKELEDELNLYKGSLKIPFKNYGDDGTTLSSDEISSLL